MARANWASSRRRFSAASTSSLRRGVFVSSCARSMENDDGSRLTSQSASASVTLLRACSGRFSFARVASVVVSAWSSSTISVAPFFAIKRSDHVRVQRCSVIFVVTLVDVSFVVEEPPKKPPLVSFFCSTTTVGPSTSRSRSLRYVVVPPKSHTSWSLPSPLASRICDAFVAPRPSSSANARDEDVARRTATSAAANLSP
mmetsp:Transcript_15154/g.43132  ORF Transcript_15154/g.43132 Transcript_15154/m.43132 type:complete len:200 (+) Transcript_15154:2163-2762(+)